MPKVNGFFLENWGMVRAQVGIVGVIYGGTWLDITFKIDTASSVTVLLDNDFLQVCHVLGWSPHRNPDILNWIRTQPRIFEDTGKASCVAGQTNRIYRTKGSILLLCNPDRNIPRGWTYQGPISGTFSAGFLDVNGAIGGAASCSSLLGTDKLNELDKMLWSWPKQTIKLTQ